ncbi:hypothetical protein FA10DRAFT_267255 [Acaromyces ingoldii]|uniref:Uncharacterized protein n=1 Tax=Acaromyces ingoldii TaxID=215250 RepID=A0A316YS40_9BASI|nr:hypothetical protein FA10DRAFT_267255 [Acaromyces ingoldii]PWN90823.1 hypothetical protein FA10DRAFT_267255 [Acaromyces ingoldii]
MSLYPAPPQPFSTTGECLFASDSLCPFSFFRAQTAGMPVSSSHKKPVITFMAPHRDSALSSLFINNQINLLRHRVALAFSSTLLASPSGFPTVTTRMQDRALMVNVEAPAGLISSSEAFFNTVQRATPLPLFNIGRLLPDNVTTIDYGVPEDLIPAFLGDINQVIDLLSLLLNVGVEVNSVWKMYQAPSPAAGALDGTDTLVPFRSSLEEPHSTPLPMPAVDPAFFSAALGEQPLTHGSYTGYLRVVLTLHSTLILDEIPYLLPGWIAWSPPLSSRIYLPLAFHGRPPYCSRCPSSSLSAHLSNQCPLSEDHSDALSSPPLSCHVQSITPSAVHVSFSGVAPPASSSSSSSLSSPPSSPAPSIVSVDTQLGLPRSDPHVEGFWAAISKASSEEVAEALGLSPPPLIDLSTPQPSPSPSPPRSPPTPSHSKHTRRSHRLHSTQPYSRSSPLKSRSSCSSQTRSLLHGLLR